MLLNYFSRPHIDRFGSRKKVVSFIISVCMMSACGDMTSLKKETLCDSETAKTLLDEMIKQSISDKNKENYKERLSNDGVKLDLANLRAMQDQIDISIYDVRTTKDDPASSKDFCESELTLLLPEQIVSDANEAMSMENYGSVDELAVELDLNYELYKVKKKLEYFVQPTDDGQKLYVGGIKDVGLFDFSSTVITHAAMKPVLKRAKTKMAQENLKNRARLEKERERLIQEEKTDAIHSEISLQNDIVTAQKKNKFIKGRLNKLWSKQSAAIQDYLTPYQKQWLDERDNTCLTEAMNADGSRQELVRIECEARLTKERLVELKTTIADLKK